MYRSGNINIKDFFYSMRESRENIFRSGGLVFIYCGMIKNDFLHELGHKFIFAVRQRKEVKKRGKYSKNKKSHERGTITIKERFRSVTNKFQNEYREIYVRIMPPDKQLCFYFASQFC